MLVVDVTVLGLVGGAPGGETPRVADSSAAGAGRLCMLEQLPRVGGVDARPSRFSVPTHRLLREQLSGPRTAPRGVLRARFKTGSACPALPSPRARTRAGRQSTIVLVQSRHSRAPAACIATNRLQRRAQSDSSSWGGQPKSASAPLSAPAASAPSDACVAGSSSRAAPLYPRGPSSSRERGPPSTEQVARWSSCTRRRS